MRNRKHGIARVLALLCLLGAFLAVPLAPTAHASWLGGVVGALLGGGSSSVAGYCKVVGKVVDNDNRPISGITVTYSLDKGGAYRTTTNESGNYAMTVPVPEQYSGRYGTIEFTGTDWRRVTYKIYTRPDDETIANQTIQHDYISGKVTDPNGNPMEWVKLEFELNGGQNGVQTIYTDAGGNYKYTLPESARSYWITISQDGYQTKRFQDILYDENVRNYTMYEQ